METINGEFTVLQGNKNASREGVNEHLLNSRKNELEILRKDPELQEITDGPLFDFAIEAKNELIKRNKELGISTPDRNISLFVASEKWWIKNGGDPAINFGTINPDASSIIVSDYKAAIVNLGSDSEFRLFNQMITIGHEIYHLMPPENYILESEQQRKEG